MKIMKYGVSIILLVVLCNFYTNIDDERKAIDITKSVVDKIMRESVFDFKSVLQKEVVDMQIIDFEGEFGKEKGVYYAASNVVSDRDTILEFGLSYSGGIKIWLSDKMIISAINDNAANMKEIAYGLFVYDKKVKLELHKGNNKLLIKLVAGEYKPIIYLREYPDEIEAPLTSGFQNINADIQNEKKKWLIIGSLPYNKDFETSLDYSYPPENSFEDYYKYNNEIYSWDIQKDNLLRELVIKESNSYKRESYLEWHYANGITLLSILEVADKTNEKTYKNFVQKFCDFTLENYDYFKYQYEELNALRGTNHKIFRKTMLDDTSGPALPFVQLYLDEKNEDYKSIVFKMADYLENEQPRLADGTLCRPEPVEMTVWADDLFMSVPYLVRMAKITGDNKYYDDAALQVIKFNERLFDKSTDLYKHGWFQKENEKSVVYWGRANGWIIWAVTEALMYLPKDHPSYKEILSIYKKHVEGLIKQQSSTGMWHQVLDKHDSFKETSCSAMFTMAILRGVKYGWLNDTYKEYALKAWSDIKNNIKDDGTVIDICRGTGIGFDLEFYYNRKRFDNDPRGLGAVLQAALEVSEIENN